jgi:hypothetical protein
MTLLYLLSSAVLQGVNAKDKPPYEYYTNGADWKDGDCGKVTSCGLIR